MSAARSVSLQEGSHGAGSTAHLVQFYDREDALLAEVGDFLRPVAAGREAGVVVVTREHWARLAPALAGASVTVLDARETLDRILDGGRPDPTRFHAVVAEAVRAAAARGQRVRAVGEMVALLCQDGRPEDAVALERLWSALAQTHGGVTVLCAYPSGAFQGAPALRAAACAEHGIVALPRGPTASALERETYIATLERKAALLESERRRRRSLEAALELSRTDATDFLANGPEGMHQVDADGVILWVNQAELDMLGYEESEYVGRRIQDFHEDPAVVEGIFSRLRAGQQVVNQRSRLRCKDGSLKDVLINSNGALDPSGRFQRSRCTVRDITDLAQAERDLVRAESLLQARIAQQAAVARLGHRALAGGDLHALFGEAVRAIAETLGVRHVGLCERKPDGTFSFVAGVGWRDGVVGMTGMRPSPRSMGTYMVQHRVPCVYLDAAAEARFEVSPLVRGHGLVSGVTVVVPSRDGVWGILGAHSAARREFTEDDVHFLDAVAQLLAGAIDRQAMEETLRTRERQQAAVARLGHEALAHADLDALFDSAVRAVAETLGVEYSGLLELSPERHHAVLRAGHGWRPGFVGLANVPAGATAQAGYAMAAEGPVVYFDLERETRFQPASMLVSHGCHSGMTVLVKTRAGPFGTLGAHTRSPRRFSTDDTNFLVAVAHILGSALDRRSADEETRRSRAHLEDMVAERTRQLAASNKELEAFSYSVSHDLRAPLRTISGYTSLLESRHGDSLTPESRQLLEGVRKSADRLGRLIDDLLDLSRVQRVDLVRETVDLSALANQVLRDLAASDPGRTVRSEVEPGVKAEGDPRLLAMLLENLLGNAWKFTRNTPDARIEFGHQGTNGDSVFHVRDTGAGFDMAYAGRLFQPFQRLHRASEFEGTGIGLATVQRIVERHGGKVWAEGRVGGGASFYFTLGHGP